MQFRRRNQRNIATPRKLEKTSLFDLLNKPIGLWLLSTIAVGSIGFSYELYKREQELSLERLSMANELSYRMDIAEKQTGILVFDCSKLIALKRTVDNDFEQGKKFRQFAFRMWKKDPEDYLFRENANTSTFALISRYEINLNRSYFRRLIERRTMPIEDVILSLMLAHLLTDESDKGEPILDLYSYVVTRNFFDREVQKHYHRNKNGPDKSEWDCGERWNGNL